MTDKDISYSKIPDKPGEVGIGVVYKAADIKTERVVFLKFHSPHLLKSRNRKEKIYPQSEGRFSVRPCNICIICSPGSCLEADRELLSEATK